MALFKHLSDPDDPSGVSSVSIMFEDDFSTVVVDSTHADYEDILDLLQDSTADTTEQEASLRGILQTFVPIGQKLRSLSDRVTYNDGYVFYNHEPIDDQLANIIKSLVEEGDDIKLRSLINFLEKLYAGASETGRRNLFRWISDRHLTISSDGDFLAYKGVQVIDGESRSINTGTSYVNNVRHSGTIPNPLNGIITMPPSEVVENEDIYCGPGLHAGTWEFASQWARGRVLLVKINPADVISVPKDCEGQKIRVCRYVVMEATEQPLAGYVRLDADEETLCGNCDRYLDDENDLLYEDGFCYVCRYEDEYYCEDCGISKPVDEGCEECEKDYEYESVSSPALSEPDESDEDPDVEVGEWFVPEVTDVVVFDDNE